MVTEIYIGTNKLDLFKDDSIIIKSAVSKIEDITKVFTDTSNDFSVPATDKNNATFKHYYNASVNNPFDARQLVLGVIYLDGLHHRTVNFRLKKVIVKNQKADSYSLEFYGLLTKLKELLKDDKLNSLDFSSYNYAQTSSNVAVKLQSNTPSRDVSATLLTTKRCIYDSNSNTNNTEFIKNVAINNNTINSGLSWFEASNSLLNIRIIEAIESAYGLTFSRDFFGKQAFSNLYLLLNGGKPYNEFYEQLVFSSSNDSTRSGNVLLSGVTLQNQLLNIDIDINSGVADFDIIIKSDNEVISEKINPSREGISYKSSDFSKFTNLTFFIRSRTPINYNVKIRRGSLFTGSTTLVNAKDISGTFNISEKMPDIKVIDYLKGLFQTFKLIVIPTSSTTLFVDSIENYYRSGKTREITKYIDFSKTPVSSGKSLNEIDYKFQESQTLLGQQFKSNTGVDYGNLELSILDDTGKLIEGEKKVFELPFENMIYEKLTDISGKDKVNIVYGLMVNSGLEPVTIKPHLHYINNVGLDSKLKLLRNDSSVIIISNLNVPSHTLGFAAPQFSTVFGEEFNEYNGVKIINTLYNNYHKNYIDANFNLKKRSYNFKIKDASIDLIKNLQLNDILIIKGKTYRIDSYETNIIKNEISLNLINLINPSLQPFEYLTADLSEVYASSSLLNDTTTVNQGYSETPE